MFTLLKQILRGVFILYKSFKKAKNRSEDNMNGAKKNCPVQRTRTVNVFLTAHLAVPMYSYLH